MTPAQWARAVEVLEKELGLEGQPRAVVLHEKHGREHIHVVWARTDLDTMTMRSDSMNFAAHERASQALELEFGHEAVPGKHAKRDREKQPEFPKAEVHHDEWQQAERAGISIEERRAQLAALQRASDNLNGKMGDGLSFLATVGSTSPFVGLFGTVYGILNALVAIGLSGQPSIDKVAGPVGEALIMTALGLAVAVPAVFSYNILLRRNKAIQDSLREFTSDLEAYIIGGVRPETTSARPAPAAKK